jgi:formylglycine-generating enzyme required for sulfatase activity
MKILWLVLLAIPCWAEVAKGTLEIKSNPGGAEVFIDGKKKGVTPEDSAEKLIVRLPEGDYNVELNKPGIGSATKKVFVGEDVVQPLSFALRAEFFTNSLGMKFGQVTIHRGRTAGKELRFSIHETRYMDFKAFVEETGYDPMAHTGYDPTEDPEGNNKPGDWKSYVWKATNSHPVVNVSWQDANAFCTWLTKKEQAAGLIKADQRYRLPTDHEWSCAAGIGAEEKTGLSPQELSDQIKIYTWGKDFSPPRNRENLSSDFECDDHEFSAPVGSFPANENGLHDIGGNVSELCEDLYSNEENWRTLRGSSWYEDAPERLNLSHRSAEDPNGRLAQVGFRCILVTGDAHVFSSTAEEKSAPKIEAPAAPKMITNSLDMRFVPVPIRGGDNDGQTVWFSIWETRYMDFKAFVDDTGYDAAINPNSGSQEKENWQYFPWPATYAHPVIMLNSRDITAFCEWLTKKERAAGNITDKQVYRLPRDQEWSCAACLSPEEKPSGMPKNFYDYRGELQKDAKPAGKKILDGVGDEESYAWKGDWPPPENFANLGEELEVDEFPNTAPVGSFQPNHYGLYDMAGNVSECIGGDYVSVPYRTFGILRGSSWVSQHSHRQFFTSTRISNNSMVRQKYVGFRCVLATEP